MAVELAGFSAAQKIGIVQDCGGCAKKQRDERETRLRVQSGWMCVYLLGGGGDGDEKLERG